MAKQQAQVFEDTALVAALQSARDWIKHWQKDKACDLAPTDRSLADALAEIEAALFKASA